MEAITFEIKGLKELEQELLKLPDKIARRCLARAAAAGARIVRDKARENARREFYSSAPDEKERPHTGELAKAIRVRKKRTYNWRTTQIYGIGFLGKGWYGRLYEYGFKNPIGKRIQRATIRPALDENAEQAANAVKEQIEKEIMKIQINGIARAKRH